jgi:hypothetical protein
MIRDWMRNLGFNGEIVSLNPWKKYILFKKLSSSDPKWKVFNYHWERDTSMHS